MITLKPHEIELVEKAAEVLLDMISDLVGPGTERSCIDHVFKRLQDAYGPRHNIVRQVVSRVDD